MDPLYVFSHGFWCYLRFPAWFLTMHNLVIMIHAAAVAILASCHSWCSFYLSFWTWITKYCRYLLLLVVAGIGLKLIRQFKEHWKYGASFLHLYLRLGSTTRSSATEVSYFNRTLKKIFTYRCLLLYLCKMLTILSIYFMMHFLTSIFLTNICKYNWMKSFILYYSLYGVLVNMLDAYL